MKFSGGKDKYIIIGILAVCIILFGIYSFVSAHDEPARAEIYYYSNLIKTIDLREGEDEVFTIPENEDVKINLYGDGSIAFAESDCPDKVCINTGKIKTPGQSSACLPNGIVIKIVSADENDEDVPDTVIGS